MRSITYLQTIVFISTVHGQRYCKPTFGSADWPTDAAWAALNQSLSGNLQAVIPPGAVCHPDWPQYNLTQCAVVANNWTNTAAHAADPVSVDYNDDTCRPNSTLPCSASGYPRYVIEAKTASDVQEGVRFARKTGVRLVIKNTGHNFPGRSSGSDSLLIHTHLLRGMTYTPDDPAAVALGGVGSAKIFAGEQMRDVYAFASANNITIVGGADPDVGVGGYISGGGHSPVSAKFGLGADQVIGMEVVTAEGEYLDIDAENSPDLFWALRGGGSSTFAVLISTTVKAHAQLSGADVVFSYNTTSNSPTFWSILTLLHTQLPSFSEAGVMGYISSYPAISSAESPSGVVGNIQGRFIAPGYTPDRLKAVLAPYEANITSGYWADKVVAYSSTPVLFEDFAEHWFKVSFADKAGYTGRLGSRLFGNETLLGDFEELREALKTATKVPGVLLGHLVSGPGVRSPPGGVAGGSNAVLGAWREAYMQVVTVRLWGALNETQKLEETTELREVAVEALRKVSPGSGAYLNECDPTEPDWQQTFFGSNYERLLEVKQKWDPTGVFWCSHCVGSELWSAEGPYGIENGIGQNPTQLCRAA